MNDLLIGAAALAVLVALGFLGLWLKARQARKARQRSDIYTIF